MWNFYRLTLSVLLLPFLWATAVQADRSFLLNGIDSKVRFSEPGKLEFIEPGEDLVNILDITNPSRPVTVANLKLSNSLFGPPTNLQVTPNEKLALVTSAMRWAFVDDKWEPTPDNRLFVIDLESEIPQLIDTITVGRQPSGIAISPSGRFALIANRADRSVSVVEINGKSVKLIQSVDVTDEVAAVAITPDESRALIVKNKTNKIGVLAINQGVVTYQPDQDMPVGQFPYNIDISPDGTFAVAAHTGNGGRSDGHADPLVIIRLDVGDRPHVSGYVTAGDAPEAFAISPRGDIAVALLLGGDTMLPKEHWAHKRPGEIAVFKVSKNEVALLQSIPIKGLPEGVAFSPDGGYVYVSSFALRQVMVFRVEGQALIDTGTRVDLPGTPASMRGRAR